MQQDNQNPENQNLEASSENLQSGAAGSLDDRIGELEHQLSEAQAAVLYAKAEGENIRRRAHEDIDKARKFALERFSGELLAMGRATRAGRLRKGISMGTRRRYSRYSGCSSMRSRSSNCMPMKM